MRVEDIKARVSVADMLTHFGSTKHNKKWRCLFPTGTRFRERLFSRGI